MRSRASRSSGRRRRCVGGDSRSRPRCPTMRGISAVLKNAQLPLHFPPHCLRHTFASLLLPQGESPAHVQHQLGHASTQLTVEPTDAGSHWATRLPSIASTTRLRERAVPKWQQTACLGGRVLRHPLNWLEPGDGSRPDLLITKPLRRPFQRSKCVHPTSSHSGAANLAATSSGRALGLWCSRGPAKTAESHQECHRDWLPRAMGD